MIPVFLLLQVLFSFVALAEELEKVGEGLFTQLDAFRTVFYTAPRRIVDLLPVTTLLGGLMGLGDMAARQELIAARVAGLSRPRMAAPVLCLALTLALAALAMQSLVVPGSERHANEIRARALVQTSVDAGTQLDFWTRAENHMVHVSDVEFGRLLTGIEIYTTDAEGRLQQLVQARQAAITGIDDWVLKDITLTTIAGGVASEEHRDELQWPGLLTASQTAILMLPMEALAPLDLSRLIDHQRANGLDTHRLRIALWQQLSIAVAIIGMALLTLPMLLGSIRAIPAGQRIVLGGLLGIGFYLLQQLAGHLAGLFALNPPGMIMTPAVLVLAVAAWAQFLDAHRKRWALKRAKAPV
jgi:lipopolysaccharide export system permease protein